jgi:hypothetical protein
MRYFCGNDQGVMGRMGDMRTIMKSSLVTGLFVLVFGGAYGQELNDPNNLPPCPRDQTAKWNDCWGSRNDDNGSYFGEFKGGYFHGFGRYLWTKGGGYVGEWRNNERHGQGFYEEASKETYKGEWSHNQFHGKGWLYRHKDQKTFEGVWDRGIFIREEILDSPEKKTGPNEPKSNKRSDVLPAWYAAPPVDKDYIFVSTSFAARTQARAIFLSEIFGKHYMREQMKLRVQETSKILLNQIEEEKNINLKNEIEDFLIEFQDFDASVFLQEKKVYEEQNGYRAFVLQKVPVNWIDSLLVAHISKSKKLQKIVFGSSLFNELKAKIAKQPAHEDKESQKADGGNPIKLEATATQPAPDGSFVIIIKTNTDTASLKINGSEMGGKADGRYTINRIARAGQDTTLEITAQDVYGNTDTKTILVSRAIVDSKAVFAALNPANIKKQVERDAVAVVIGIADYRSLARSDFSNDDARAFYDYAIRALGIKPENIKLLVDGDAEEAEILKTFRTWLPSRVKSTTDVYVFYSGHGLPMPDGKGLYLVPPRADREVIDDTAIPFSKLNAALTLAKPKSVTIFLDACYSGQARSGETLVANARPVQIKSDSRYFPENFTVITASQNDQISSSNPELQHGIFSYYLMKGMEGDADANRDGKITLGEMQTYLIENVGRHAAMMSRKQEPQLIGDVNRVLVGR